MREVPMPDILVDALKEYKIEQQLNEQEHKSDLTKPTSLVFGNNDGSVRTYSGTKKIFYRFLEKNNLDKLGIHFHGLRHTYSNMLFEANQNPKVIQSLLGHKSVNTTITTYNSVDKSYFKKATDVIDEQFNTEKLKSNKKEEVEETLDNLSNGEIDHLVEILEKRKKRKLQDEEM